MGQAPSSLGPVGSARMGPLFFPPRPVIESRRLVRSAADAGVHWPIVAFLGCRLKWGLHCGRPQFGTGNRRGSIKGNTESGTDVEPLSQQS